MLGSMRLGWAASLPPTPTDYWSIFPDSGYDPQSIATIPNNAGLVAVGQTGGTTGLITKFDATGAKSWAKTFGTIINDVVADSSGNIYVAGRTVSGSDSDVLIAKFSSTGSVTWQRRLDMSGSSVADEQGYSVGVMSNGNVVVAGNFWFANYYRLGVVVYNSSGTFQWCEYLSAINSSNQHRYLDLVIDSSNNIYLTGVDLNGATVIVKYNSTGTIQWQKALGNVGFDSIDIDSSGNLYLAGGYGEALGIALYKLSSSDGSTIWQKGVVMGSYGITDVKADPQGGAICALRTYEGGSTTVMKFDDDGALVYRNTMQTVRSGTTDVPTTARGLCLLSTTIEDVTTQHFVVALDDGLYNIVKLPTDGSRTGINKFIGNNGVFDHYLEYAPYPFSTTVVDLPYSTYTSNYSDTSLSSSYSFTTTLTASDDTKTWTKYKL